MLQILYFIISHFIYVSQENLINLLNLQQILSVRETNEKIFSESKAQKLWKIYSRKRTKHVLRLRWKVVNSYISKHFTIQLIGNKPSINSTGEEAFSKWRRAKCLNEEEAKNGSLSEY